MEWQIIVALVIVIPVILLPVAFIWFLNIGGVYAAVKESLAVRRQSRKELAEAKQHVKG